jgi:tetratricopeptide (TPR) repeat protein
MKQISYLVFIFFIVFCNPGLLAQEENEYTYEFALLEAARQKTIGNINEAIKLYKRCIEVKPDSDVAYYELGSIYAALNQDEIAEKFLEKSYTLHPENYWYMLAYIQILNFKQQYNRIIPILEVYLKNNSDAGMKYSLANAYSNAGRNRKALRILEEIEKENGIAEQVILKKVEILKDLKKFDKAENELLKLIDVIPESPEYHIIMAEYYEETGHMGKALEYFNQAYTLDTTNIYAISNLADYYTKNGPVDLGLYYLNRAFTLDEITLEKKLSTLLYYMGEDELLTRFNKEFEIIVYTLLTKYPDNYDVKTIAYDFFNRSEKFKKAYEIIMQLLDQKKDNFILWQQAIYTASLLNKYDDIIDLGKEAMEIFPNKKEFLMFMGIAYFQKEDFNLAYETLMKGYEPGLPLQMQIQYLTFLAESSYKIGKSEESFYFFEELLLLEPDNYIVLNNYSYYLALDGIELKRAEELSRKTVEKFPENATYLDTYAWILFKLQRYEDAKFYMDKVIEKQKDNPELTFHYGWILCKLGNIDAAVKYFELSRSTGYENIEEIEQALKECE